MRHLYFLLIKQLTILSVLFLTVFAVQAQAPVWDNALAFGSNVAASAVTSSGDVVLVGTYRGVLNLNGTVLTAIGADDGFVAKWNPSSRQFVWAVGLGGPLSEGVTSVTARGADVYVAGHFNSANVNFGPMSLANTSTSAGIGFDLFVAKVTETGTNAAFVWVKSASGSGSESATSIAVNGASVYVAGYLEGSVSFDNNRLTSAGLRDGFVVKLTDFGSSASYTRHEQACESII